MGRESIFGVLRQNFECIYVSDGINIEISEHLTALKENFDYHFIEEMKNC